MKILVAFTFLLLSALATSAQKAEGGGASTVGRLNSPLTLGKTSLTVTEESPSQYLEKCPAVTSAAKGRIKALSLKFGGERNTLYFATGDIAIVCGEERLVPLRLAMPGRLQKWDCDVPGGFVGKDGRMHSMASTVLGPFTFIFAEIPETCAKPVLSLKIELDKPYDISIDIKSSPKAEGKSK